MKKKLGIIAVIVLSLILSFTVVFADTYTVKSGDVLWKIAQDKGVTVDQIKAINNIDDSDIIYPGQILTTALSQQSTSTKCPSSNSEMPKYVFMFIGDGLGFSQRQFSEYYLQTLENDPSKKLLMNTFSVSGINTTHSADALITDSAAAGTALATGFKTNNGVISQDANGNNVRTLIEEAEARGMATGLVTTTRLTHATPATFAAHNISRGNENEIAEDYLDSGVDFFAGGGLRHFIPQNYQTDQTDSAGKTIKSKRKDDKNIVDEFDKLGYETYLGMNGAKAFKTEDFSDIDKVFAAFTYTHLPYEIDRINQQQETPSLADMTDKCIQVLEKDEDGFFVMVEGGRIDHASHANDAASTVNDTLAFDDAIQEAYEFYLEHPQETLILVVGDHETGGMGLGMDTKGYFVDPSVLIKAKASIEDVVFGKYTGDRESFKTYIGENLGLNDLTEDELAKLEKGMDDADAGITYGYYNYNSAGMAVTHIISERANIFWTTTIHTGTAIPMSAIGIGAETFDGYKDNTEIARAMADLMGFELSK